MSFLIEVSDHVEVGREYPIAINTALDQIPLRLSEAETFLGQLQMAIWKARGISFEIDGVAI